MAKDETTISIYRGDTAAFHFHREDANGATITTQADAAYFTVKEKGKEHETDYAFQKSGEDFSMDANGEYHFTILPTDTDGLDFRKLYSYDLEIVASDVKTTIASGLFVLKMEVTHAANESEG